MYPGQHAVQRADQPAIVMARSGETITYRELEACSNRLAHLLRAIGLKRLPASSNAAPRASGPGSITPPSIRF